VHIQNMPCKNQSLKECSAWKMYIYVPRKWTKMDDKVRSQEWLDINVNFNPKLQGQKK